MQVNTPSVFWATHKLGGAVSPVNPAYGPSELAYQLKDSESIALITSSGLLQTALKAIEDVPAISPNKVFIIDGNSHASHTTIEELIENGRKSGRRVESLQLKKGEGKTRLAFICYSSGTTGLPKGVMISHYNVISNVCQIALHAKDFDDKKRETTLALLPLYHIYGTLFATFLTIGLVYVLHSELYLGNTCVIIPSFDFATFLSYLQKYRMTRLYLVPPIVIRLAKDELTKKYDLSSLEQIVCGAAPLGSDTMGLLRSKFKGIIFRQGYCSGSSVNFSVRDDGNIDGGDGTATG